ncbi:MAG: hypothetical protein PHO57_10290 [Acidithiobacillus sp.]|nr:hypothetical protein [Acidithiobacillus sp.]
MDFLSRRFVGCALVGSLCLVSLPVFATTFGNPDLYTWVKASDGTAYRVFDPRGSYASSLYGPSSPSSAVFSDASASGVVEHLPAPPLTIDGSTGLVVDGLSVSRSLTLGDLAAGVGRVLSLDNPIGLGLLAAGVLAPLVESAYQSSLSASSSSSLPGSSVSPSSSYNSSCVVSGGGVSASSPYAWCLANVSSEEVSEGQSFSLSGCTVDGSTAYVLISNGVSAAGTLNNCTLSSSSSSSVTPSSAIQYFVSNPSQVVPAFKSALSADPALAIPLANALSQSGVPALSPSGDALPFTYNIPSSDSSIQGSPTTTTSTDPATGDSVVTKSVPTYKLSDSPDGGISISKDITTTTSTCTSSGSCAVTNTTTVASSPSVSTSQSPSKGSPFVPPSPLGPVPSVPSSTVPLSLSVSHNPGTCPPPLSISALSQTFTVPLKPFCNLATYAHPYVESLGAVGASIVIFR